MWPEYLLKWFWQVKRDLPWRKTKDPYAIWVSEIMLQQTQVKTVIPYYLAFLERFPTVQSLAQAELEKVLEQWRGLGYYSRARHLWEGARFILEKEVEKFPENYEELLKIPGVGEYTAGAIASIAFHERVPAIDGNVNRVLARLLAWEESTGKVKSRRAFREVLEECQPADYPGDFNQAMMELGATLCAPKIVQCEACPLNNVCKAHELGLELAFPVKQAQQRVTEVIRLTLLIRKGEEFLIKKRPAQGLLANLWEFPGEEILKQDLAVSALQEQSWPSAVAEFGADSISAAKALEGHGRQSVAEAMGGEKATADAKVWYELYQRVEGDRSQDQRIWDQLQQNFEVKGPIYHGFSHRRWEMYWVVLAGSEDMQLQEDMRWASMEELEKIALPVAFQKLLQNEVEKTRK